MKEDNIWAKKMLLRNRPYGKFILKGKSFFRILRPERIGKIFSRKIIQVSEVRQVTSTKQFVESEVIMRTRG